MTGNFFDLVKNLLLLLLKTEFRLKIVKLISCRLDER